MYFVHKASLARMPPDELSVTAARHTYLQIDNCWASRLEGWGMLLAVPIDIQLVKLLDNRVWLFELGYWHFELTHGISLIVKYFLNFVVSNLSLFLGKRLLLNISGTFEVAKDLPSLPYLTLSLVKNTLHLRVQKNNDYYYLTGAVRP